jgi:hypothetical protein
LKRQRDRHGKFGYLLIFEKHKDGSIHLHALFKDFTGKLVDSGHKSKRGQVMYNFSGWTAGIVNNAEKIADLEKSANYVTKYITKDIERNAIGQGKKRYWCSSGLIRPIRDYQPSPIIERFATHKLTYNYEVPQCNVYYLKPKAP